MATRPATVRSLGRLLLGVAIIASSGLWVAAASAQDGNGTPAAPQVSVPHIIPLPNTGTPPKYSTDPGGWAQYSVFWVMLAAIGFLIFLVWRESVKKRRAFAASVQDERTSTRNEPVAESSEKPSSSALQ